MDKTIIKIPKKLIKADKELRVIRKKRKVALDNVTKCYEKTKDYKKWALKIISTKKADIEEEVKFLMMYKSVEVLSLLSECEKKAIYNQINRRILQFQKEYNNLKKFLIDKRMEIGHINDYFLNIKKDRDEFQSYIEQLQLDEIVISLNDIELSKRNIENSIKTNMNDLITIRNKQ